MTWRSGRYIRTGIMFNYFHVVWFIAFKENIKHYIGDHGKLKDSFFSCWIVISGVI